MAYNFITAQEAAQMIPNGATVGFSGFTAPGAPKFITEALAAIAEEEHAQGRPFKINILSGASTSDHADGVLARANAINLRAPYQNKPDLRKRINSHDCHYCDRHLSDMAQETRYGFYGNIDFAIIEAADITPDGEIILGCGLGNTPTYAAMADKILIELNDRLPKTLLGMHDVYMPLDPPYRREIAIYKPSDRVGSPILKIDPNKVVGIVKTSSLDGVSPFTEPDEVSKLIGNNVVDFLVREYKRGALPKEFLPLQSGVGNVANAVLYNLGESTVLPKFQMYTEVIQDAVFELIRQGKCTFASTCSMTFSDKVEEELFANIDYFHDKIVMRPAEISNNPEVIRRLGVIAMNTALEADIFGGINSTHVLGTKMMNGIGGSGDFTRSAYVSIFRRSRQSHHRELRSPRLPSPAARVSQNGQGRPDTPLTQSRLRFPHRLHRNRRYAQRGLLQIPLNIISSNTKRPAPHSRALLIYVIYFLILPSFIAVSPKERIRT